MGVLRGTESTILAELFAKGTQSEVTLNLAAGGNAALWQSEPLKVYRTRGGGSGNHERGGRDGGGSGDGGGESPPGAPPPPDPQ